MQTSTFRKFLRLGVTAAGLAVAAFALAGCSTAHELPHTLLTFGFQTMDPGAGKSLTMPISGLKYNYIASLTLTEVDVATVNVSSAEVGPGQYVPSLDFTFDTQGERILYRETALHQGLLLFVFISEGGGPEKPIGACRITEPLGDGQLSMFVEVPSDKLPSLLQTLQESVAKLQTLKR